VGQEITKPLVCGGRSEQVLGNALFRYRYRIIVWFGLEGTFKGHLVQPPCNEQGHLPLDQVAQSPIQPDLVRFKQWRRPVCKSYSEVGMI